MIDLIGGLPLLSLIIACPLLASLLTLVVPQALIKPVNALFAGCALVLSGLIWAAYDATTAGFQLAESHLWVEGFDIHYAVAVDGIGVVLVLLNALVFFTGVLSMWTLTERIREYFAFMAILVFGVFGVFVSTDLFAFFFFYEVAVLPMYPLIAVWGSTRKEYSAMKLTLFLMAGSALLFPALLAIWSLGGADTWSLTELAARAPFDAATQRFLYPFIYIGFGILAGMFPFHSWSPTGHVAAPTAVSMLHAGVLMKLGAFGILRIGIGLLPEGAAFWAPTFGALATAGILYGAFVAMRQTDFKYVIGFSSVSHMGIVLLGLNTLSVDGTTGAVFQMFAHGVMTALFFSSVGFIYDQTHDRDIRRYGGLVTQVPIISGLFIIASFSGMGVPGFASFWAELLVFIAAVKTWPVLGVLAIAGLVFTAAYVLRVLGKAMFGAENPERAGLTDVGPFAAIPRVLLAAVLVFFGFYPSPILDLVRSALGVLTTGGPG